MMLQKAEHIGINVSDMDRSVRWYTEVLGLTVRARVRMSETTEISFLPIGDTELELVCRSGPFQPGVDGTVNHLAFTVSDVAAVLDRLRAHGVQLLNEAPVDVPPLGARIAFFRGPDGEKFELFEHTTRSGKLVRDRIPELIRASGRECEVDVLSDEAYRRELDRKLGEELQEYQRDQTVEELADVIEVVRAILAARGVSLEEFEALRLKKQAERGGFGARYFWK